MYNINILFSTKPCTGKKFIFDLYLMVCVFTLKDATLRMKILEIYHCHRNSIAITLEAENALWHKLL